MWPPLHEEFPIVYLIYGMEGSSSTFGRTPHGWLSWILMIYFQEIKSGASIELHIILKTIGNDFTMLMTSSTLSSSGKSGQIAFVTNDTNQSVLIPFNSTHDFLKNFAKPPKGFESQIAMFVKVPLKL